MIEVSKSGIFGTFNTPPSKSITHREFIISALSEGVSEIKNPLFSDDTFSTLNALKKMGAEIITDGDCVKISGGKLSKLVEKIDCGNSATTLRFLTAITSVLGWNTEFTGDESLMKRPMKELKDALSSDEIFIRGDISSQFISALLISAPLRKTDTIIHLTTKIESEPYVNLTIQSMKNHGVIVEKISDGYFVRKGQKYKSYNSEIPGDYSSAAFILSAGVLCGDVTVKNLSPSDTQGDKKIISILKKFGADVFVGSDFVRAKKSRLHGIEIDLSDNPDLFQIICVLASFAEGETKISGISRLKYKESDRVAETVNFLKSMGADISADSVCIIHGKNNLSGAEIFTKGDHRTAMSAVIAGVASNGTTKIDNDSCINVSYPNFIADLKNAGADIR